MVKITLGIEGMACGMCEVHINNTIRRSFRVKSVKSSFSKGKTEIVTEDALDEAKLRAVIDATGYIVTSFATESYEKKKGFPLFRR